MSEGCRHCYAESIAYRFSGPGRAYEGLVQLDMRKDGAIVRLPKWNGKIQFVEKHLLDPLKWSPIAEHVEGCRHLQMREGRKWLDRCGCPARPRRIFVNSMSDLFHENVTDEMRDKIFAVMALCPQHTFQVLTKRPERMLEYLAVARAAGRIADVIVRMRRERGDRCLVGPLAHIPPGAVWYPLANIWLGVSVENQQTADERIPLLLQTPAAVRFISAEPLLGPIDLWDCGDGPLAGGHPTQDDINSDRGMHFIRHGTSRLDWVICGGESGSGARSMHPDWARGLRDQCVDAGVPYFFKQWGDMGTDIQGCGFDPTTKKGGHLLDGREWKQFPEVKA